MCKICGGPNHHGCGCEAKARKEWPGPDAAPGDISEAMNYDRPESETDEALESAFSPEAIIESDKVNKKMAKDIQTMADGFEGLCACFYDTNNLLKIIAGDLITIRKFLTKEDEVKNADPDKPEENQN